MGTILVLLVFNRPELVLYGIPLLSVLVSVLREISINLGQTQFTFSGLLWFVSAGYAVLYILVHLKQMRISSFLWPFVALSVWAFIRWILSPTFIGLKDLFWYSLPVIFGIFTQLVIENKNFNMFQLVLRINAVFLYSALIPIMVYTIALTIGLAEMTWRGPIGTLVGAARGVPLYLLIVLSLALAEWRYGLLKKRGRFFSLVSLGIIFFSLARMASILGLFLIPFYKVNPRRKWQIMGSVFLAVILIYTMVAHIPWLKRRFFFTEDWSFSMKSITTALNTSGRNIIWPIVWASAIQQPLIGHGLGKARLLVGELFGYQLGFKAYYPHNEYLHVFHDLGMVGLVLVLCAWLNILLSNWKAWRRGASPLVRRWSMASVLSTGAVLVSSLTDNTLHYPIVIVPAIIISSVSDVFRQIDIYRLLKGAS